MDLAIHHHGIDHQTYVINGVVVAQGYAARLRIDQHRAKMESRWKIVIVGVVEHCFLEAELESRRIIGAPIGQLRHLTECERAVRAPDLELAPIEFDIARTAFEYVCGKFAGLVDHAIGAARNRSADYRQRAR